MKRLILASAAVACFGYCDGGTDALRLSSACDVIRADVRSR